MDPDQRYIRQFNMMPPAYFDIDKQSAVYISRVTLGKLLESKMVKVSSQTFHSTKYKFTKKGTEWRPDQKELITESDF